MLWFFYNLLFSVAFVLMLPKFLSRMVRRGGYRRHFEQRIGSYGHNTAKHLNECRRIWIHAVSVGEIQIAFQFIETYRTTHPEARFVLSTTTSTAHSLGEKKLDARDVLIYFPLDMPWVMRRTLRAINPLKLILVECEFWPNLIRQAHQRGIPVSLINGRVSDSSFRGYMKFRPLIHRVLGMMDSICVQGEQDAERMIAMGAKPEIIQTFGTAKYDVSPPSVDASASARSILRQVGVPENATVWVGASTWPGEEKALCEIYQTLREKHPTLFLVLVPRHAERRADVVAAIEGQGLSYVLRSLNEPSDSPCDVLVVDTTGELMSFYAASDLVFVGKSLCEHGGQNPIEPALFGKPIVVGPNMENFSSVMKDFGSALRQVADFQTLEKALEDLLADDVARTQLGEAARAVVESRRGVISKMVQAVG